MKTWTISATDARKDCLNSTDWDTFNSTNSNLDDYADADTSYVSFREETCIPAKAIYRYTNKPWFTAESVRRFTKEEAYKSGDIVEYKKAKHGPNTAVKVAKHRCRDKLEEHFSSNERSATWKGIHTIADVKPKPPITEADSSLPNLLNNFYARSENQRTDTPSPKPDHRHLAAPGSTPLPPGPAQLPMSPTHHNHRSTSETRTPEPKDQEMWP